MQFSVVTESYTTTESRIEKIITTVLGKIIYQILETAL